jgi:N6-adenosine-specific RNA methylase IME4
VTYSTVVADPPWHYEFRNGGGRDDQGHVPNRVMPYQTMTVEQIAALPVSDLAEREAHLYLWTTQRYLREAYDVTDAWGFSVSSVLVWSKKPKGFVGTYVCSTEFVLFARRGTLAAKEKQLGTCFEWPRGAHAVKPEAFLDMVERVSPGPYLEMFARRARFGWDYWGDQSLGTAEMADAA